MLFQSFVAIMMYHDVDLCSSRQSPSEASRHQLLPKACSKTNQWPLLRSSLCSTQRQLSGECFKHSLLTSIMVSLSRSLLSIPRWLVFFSDELRLARTLAVHLCHVCFCAFEIQLFFLFEFFFSFFWDSFFLQGPLLMQFPVILLALSLYLNWPRCPNFGGDPRSWLPEPACDISGASCEHRTLPRCSTPTPWAAKLSDSTVCVRLCIREKTQAGWGRRR